jgi:hypothetical protein
MEKSMKFVGKEQWTIPFNLNMCHLYIPQLFIGIARIPLLVWTFAMLKSCAQVTNYDQNMHPLSLTPSSYFT